MLRKIICIISSLILCLTLCGCDLFTADTAALLSPPALSGDMHPISEAIKESVGDTYTFQYPSRGDYRSAVIQQDVNHDGILEAFAFYSTQNGETTSMHINVVENVKGEWKSVATQDITAGGVDRIDFCDLDMDGVDEILVGWEIYGTSELRLAAYSLENNVLARRMLEQYTHFIHCDLDSDDHNEIFIVRSAPAESRNTAHLYSLTENSVAEISACELDSSSKTLNHPYAATLSTGEPAIYIDEIKGVGAVTEVLYLKKGVLVNPLLDKKAKETTVTLRSASFETTDINNDGIPEIPVQSQVPTVTKSGNGETLYLTNWCSFNGEALTSQLTAMINITDGYYYSIPQKWIGKIAILKDSEGALMEIYRYHPKSASAGERLLYFRAVKKSDWDAGKYSREDVKEIVNDGETAYICYISAAAEKDGIDIDKIKTDFVIY